MVVDLHKRPKNRFSRIVYCLEDMFNPRCSVAPQLQNVHEESDDDGACC